MATLPKMATIAQCAAETGLSYDCIRKLCLQKKIVHIRSGTKYLINVDRLNDYLNGEQEETENTPD